MNPPGGRFILASMATAAVGVAVVYGIVVLGPPSESRERRLDAKRIQDLGGIVTVVNYQWSVDQVLPLTLDELAKRPGTGINYRDPVSAAPYEYRLLDARTYELCAVFDRESEAEDRAGDLWSHGTGRRCFRRSVKEVVR